MTTAPSGAATSAAHTFDRQKLDAELSRDEGRLSGNGQPTAPELSDDPSAADG